MMEILFSTSRLDYVALSSVSDPNEDVLATVVKEYRYDDTGKLTRVQYLSPNTGEEGAHEEYTYTYEESGAYTQTGTAITKSGKVNSTAVTAYNADGTVLSAESSKSYEKKVYEYNEKGLVTKCSSYYSVNSVVSYTVYKYVE